MARCKNASRIQGGDDGDRPPPPDPHLDKWKAVAEQRPRKRTRLDRGTRQAIATAAAADRAERGAGLHIRDVHLTLEGRELGIAETEEVEQAEQGEQSQQ